MKMWTTDKLKQFIKFVAVLLGALLALTQLYNWSTAPRADLIATVNYSDYEEAFDLRKELEAEQDKSLFDLDSLKSAADYTAVLKKHLDRLPAIIDVEELKRDKQWTDEQLSLFTEYERGATIPESVTRSAVDDALYSISINLRESTRSHLSYAPIYNGIYFVDIVNNGKETASSVRLYLPDTKLARIEREGAATEEIEASGRVELKAIQPSEAVSVTAWVDSSISRFDLENIKLSFTQGEGVINVLHPTGEPWASLPQKWVSYIYFLLIIVVGIIALAIIYIEYRGSSKKSDSNNNDEEK
jgi:hypothetical protein